MQYSFSNKVIKPNRMNKKNLKTKLRKLKNNYVNAETIKKFQNNLERGTFHHPSVMRDAVLVLLDKLCA